MEDAHSFGQALKAILVEQDIPAAALSDALGFSSRTSLYRILNDESSPDKAEELLRQLRSCPLITLSEAQCARLRELIDIRRYGLVGYQRNLAFQRLLYADQLTPGRYLFDLHTRKGTDLHFDVNMLCAQLDKHPGSSIKLIITGQPSKTLVYAIHSFMRHCRKSGMKLNVYHYVDTNGASFVSCLANVLPLIYLGCYEICCFDHAQTTDELTALMNVTNLFFELTLPSGVHRRYQAVAVASDRALTTELDQFAWDFTVRFLDECTDISKPITNNFLNACDVQDYLRYTEHYRDLEHDREALLYRSTLPLWFINADLLGRAAVDGFMEQGLAGNDREAVARVVTQFHRVHQQRWENIRRKRKITHMILDYQGMIGFVKTGCLRDQFFAIRPFTPEERLEILLDLRHQAQSNPFFNVYFHKDERIVINDEISLYIGGGLLLVKGNTDYQVSSGHAEALITQPEFCTHYRNFFYETLLTTRVTTTQKTLLYLDDLIEMARAGIG